MTMVARRIIARVHVQVIFYSCFVCCFIAFVRAYRVPGNRTPNTCFFDRQNRTPNTKLLLPETYAKILFNRTALYIPHVFFWVYGSHSRVRCTGENELTKTTEAKVFKVKVAGCIYTKRFRLQSLVRCLVTFLYEIYLFRDLNCSFIFHSSNVFDTSPGIKTVR